MDSTLSEIDTRAARRLKRLMRTIVENFVELPPEEMLYACWQAAVRTMAVQIIETEDLLREFVDDDPCSLDLHGYCQTHGPAPGPCRNARAQELLKSATAAESEV